MRALFEAVCDRPPEQWTAALAQLGIDPAERDEALALLRAQTAELGRLRASLRSVALDAEQPQAWVGRTLGPWRLQELIGSGGMAAVFLAERVDSLYRRKVALKVLRRPYDPSLAARLAGERQILADLRGAGIARLYEAGVSESGQHYLVMEHVEGEPLDAFVRGLGLEDRLRLFVRICRVVQTAHAQSVVHCDLKPANVLVDDEGAPVLLDFGIARLVGADTVSAADRYATPAYASPELVAGRAVGVAADVFSLGVMLAELIADRALRRTLDDAQAPIPRPSRWAGPACRWRRRLAGDLDAIAARACEVDPVARYASVEALADDVERFLGRYPVLARRPSRLRILGLGARRHWQAIAIGAIASGLGALFVVQLIQARAAADTSAAVATQVSDFLVAAFEAADPRERGLRPELTAREVLDRSAARVEAELAMAPDVRARLQVALGRAYQNLGLPRVAWRHLQAGADGLRAAGAVSETAEADVLLALQAAKEGRYDEALARLEGVSASLKPRFGAASPLLRLRILHAQAVAEVGARCERGAEARLLAALGERPDDPAWRRQAVAALRDLGAIHGSHERLEVSERMLRAALAAALEAYGDTSVEYQQVLGALSRTLYVQGRVDESVALAERNLALTARLFGAQSTFTADAESRLAGLYLDLGRYDDSARHFDRSLRISAVVDGETSRAYAGKLFGMGIMEEARGSVARAEALYRQALALYREHMGRDHETTQEVEMVLARLLMRVGRVEAAREPLRRIADLRRRTLPEGAPELRSIELSELEWLIRAGRYDEAEAALARLEAVRDSLSPGMVLRWEMQAARLAQRRGQWPRAVAAWQAVVATFSRLYGADSTATAKWRIPLAECLVELGRHEEAAEELHRARPRLAALAPEAALRVRAGEVASRLAAAGGDRPAPSPERDG